jgi:hypothetical protein
VQLGGLGRRVRRGVLARHDRVLGRDEHDRAADGLLPQDPERLARDQEVAGDEDVVVAVPLVERGVLERRARGDAGVGDEDVDAAVARHASANAPATASSLVTSPLTARPSSP